MPLGGYVPCEETIVNVNVGYTVAQRIISDKQMISYRTVGTYHVLSEGTCGPYTSQPRILCTSADEPVSPPQHLSTCFTSSLSLSSVC